MKTAPMQKTSEELDERCRKQIKRNLRKQQMKVVAKMALRYTKRVAMFIVMLFGIVGILFTTVEAVRVPIINFFIEQKDGYLDITGEENRDKLLATEKAETTNLLEELVPNGYTLRMSEENYEGGILCIFENSLGNRIILSEDPHYSEFDVDNENSKMESLTILSYEAVLISKEGFKIVWFVPEKNRICYLESDALSREQIISLAEKLENNR